MSLKLHAAVFTVGMMSFGYLVAPAVADEWDKMTIFHFNAPVEVPGHVLLPGTYVFKLADLRADRDVVQIFSEDKKGMDHIVTTAFAIPAYRLETPDKVILTFAERHSNSPEAVDKWFYPGDNYGWEFVYPKSETLQVAANVSPAPLPTQVTPVPAPSVAPKTTAPPTTAPAVVEKQQSVVIAQNLPPAAPSVPGPSTNRELPKSLPKTASDLPFAAAFGLLMVGAGAAVLGSARIRKNA